MISEPLIVGTTKMNVKGGIWMKSSNPVNQNQHCISRTGPNDTEELAGEVDKWDIKTDVNGKWREQNCIHRKRAAMRGTEGESGRSKSNAVGKEELVEWFKMDLNDWSVSADLVRSAPVC